MKRTIFSLMLLALSAGFANSGLARDAVLKARPNISVTADFVTLGDLFENTGEKSSVAVFGAPNPGESGFIRATRAAKAAHQHGLNWKNPTNLPRFNVVRESRVISASEITASITKKIAASSISQNDGGDIDLRFSIQPRPIHLPLNENAHIEVSKINIGQNGRFTVIIKAKSGGQTPPRLLTYSGRAVKTAKLPVLTRSMNKGETIRTSDIEWSTFSQSMLKRSPVRHSKDLAGKALRHRISAGKPLFSRDIERPQLVQKNSLVTIIHKSPGLTLTTRGRAMESGAMGDVVTVKNIRSKSIVQATVIAPQTVSPSVIPGEGAMPRQMQASARK